MTNMAEPRISRMTKLRYAWRRPGSLLLAALSGCTVGPAQRGAWPVQAGGTFRDLPWTPEMVVVPAGAFLMGSTDAETTREGRAPALAAAEHPQRRVRFDAPFAVGRTDVTVAEYGAFLAQTHRAVPAACTVDLGGIWRVDQPGYSVLRPGYAQQPDFPAACVSWDDAQAYTRFLSQRTGQRYRLLHEAEWEYAARGGTETARWWGDGRAGLCRHANGADRSFDKAMPGDKEANRQCDDGYAFASPVHAFPPNPFGLYDMIGNLWQWTEDCVAAEPGGRCARRAIRGGSWHNYPVALRAANRFALPPAMRSSSLGFRVMREPSASGVRR